MRSIRKSIIRKLLFDFIILTGIILAIYFVLSKYLEIELTLNILAVFLGTFSLVFLVFYYFDVVRPLKEIIYQMQSLLTGKPYKRIFTKRIDEIGTLAYFFNQVTKTVSDISSDIQDKERLMGELEVASQLQRDILPLQSPFVSGLQLVAKTKPATELGGDSFNIFNSKGKTYIYIGDVTGHGIAAGLIMTMVSSLVGVFAEMYSSAYEILVRVNQYIKKHVKKSMFMTMVMLSWDEKTQKLTFVGAGHEHILVYRADTGECEAVLSGGVALGMVPDNSKLISEKEIALSDGDFIALYTDGITEARNAEGELYGLERLKNAFKEFAPQYSAEGVHYHLASDVSDYMSQQDDDMTLIVIKRDSKNIVAEQVKDTSTAWSA